MASVISLPALARARGRAARQRGARLQGPPHETRPGRPAPQAPAPPAPGPLLLLPKQLRPPARRAARPPRRAGGLAQMQPGRRPPACIPTHCSAQTPNNASARDDSSRAARQDHFCLASPPPALHMPTYIHTYAKGALSLARLAAVRRVRGLRGEPHPGRASVAAASLPFARSAPPLGFTHGPGANPERPPAVTPAPQCLKRLTRAAVVLCAHPAGIKGGRGRRRQA